MAKLTGTNPDQVPTNADLGTMAYQDKDNLQVGDVYADGILRSDQGAGHIIMKHDGVNGSISNNTGQLLVYAEGSGAIINHTNGVERMRIDSSGNLLVGMTSANTNNDGAGIRADGLIHAKRASVVATLNRKTSDGTVVEIAKDNTVVGSIGTEGGSGFDAMYIANGDAGLIFQGYANDAIIPFDGSTLDKRDAAIDLGYASGRFKDLYLSGGVYLGGTGAANQLSDYEEGTWTPTGVTATIINAEYTKIGNTVNARLECNGSVSLTNGTTIGGLPFNARTTSVAWYFADFGVGSGYIPMSTIAGYNIYIRRALQTTGAWTTLSDTTGSYVAIQLVYTIV